MSEQRLSGQAWIALPETRAVMSALNEGGETARFVGGCVRNALLGAPVEDVDIATTRLPADVIARLSAHGLRAVETGVDHGTVTAIANGKPYEITTLRVDVATDGRRAQVAFTDDWARDAARRDFTINALYADTGGVIYDYVGGRADIAARKVRFIGDAAARIREDYLRILRFFRFGAWYATPPFDDAGLAAIKTHLEGLATLSAERVQKELLRLLTAPSPLEALRAMEMSGVTAALLPQARHLNRLARLIPLETSADPVLRLAALIEDAQADAVAERLRLSNAMAARLALLTRTDIPLTDEKALRRALYDLGGAAVSDLARLASAAQTFGADQARRIIAQAQGWTKPVFPVTGADVMARGFAPGPRVGDILRSLEAWWVDENFTPSRADLEHKLDELSKLY